MPNRRRRSGAACSIGRQRAEYLATRCGRGLRDSRLALGMTQAQAAARGGVSQSFWSRLERGQTIAVSLGTLAACAVAVDVQLAAFIEARPGADLPRDIEHLRRQNLVLILGARGGWHGRPERPIDPEAARSRSIDILLERSSKDRGLEFVVVEVEDLLADIGSSFRGLADKVAAMTREVAATASYGGKPAVRGLMVIRATRRNRETVRQLGGMFRARFPASSAAWLGALQSKDHVMPDFDGFVWSTVRGDRLFAARTVSMGSLPADID